MFNSTAIQTRGTCTNTVCVVPAIMTGASVAIMSEAPDAARSFSSSVSSFFGASLWRFGR